MYSRNHQKGTIDSDFDEMSFYGKKIKKLLDLQQCSIVLMLLGIEASGTLTMGRLAEVAKKSQTSHTTVSCILW